MTIKILLAILLLSVYSHVNAQVDDVYLYTDTPNEFIGGDDSLMTYIDKHFDFCKDVKGKESIIIKFVVETNGVYSNLTFISKNPEIIKLKIKDLMDNLPKWKPGMNSGIPVRSYRLFHIMCENGIRFKYAKQ